MKNLKNWHRRRAVTSKLKVAIQNYLDALNTPGEKTAAESLLDEIKRDVVLVEHMVILAHSNRAIEMFGAEGAKKFIAHAETLRRRGIKYCNCKACTLGVEILDNKEILLA